jgi:hypothetical protein
MLHKLTVFTIIKLFACSLYSAKNKRLSDVLKGLKLNQNVWNFEQQYKLDKDPVHQLKITFAFKFCAQAISYLLDKTHPPEFSKFKFNFFSFILHYKYPNNAYTPKTPSRSLCEVESDFRFFHFFLYTL